MAPTALHEHADSDDGLPWGSTPLTPCGSGGYRLQFGYCLNIGYCLRAAAADEEQGGWHLPRSTSMRMTGCPGGAPLLLPAVVAVMSRSRPLDLRRLRR